VFNVKISSIVAGAAFILSVLIGMISGGSFLIVLLRALICGIVFFALVAGLYVLIGIFLPELLQLGQDEESGDEENAPGSHVDISVQDEESEGAPANPEPEKDKNKETDKDKALKEAVAAAFNMKESASDEAAGLDQNLKKEYTKEEGTQEIPAEAPEAPPPETPKSATQDAPASPVKPPEAPPPAAEPWEESVGSVSIEDEVKQKSPGSEKAQSTGKAQKNEIKMDPKKMDPQKMASTIQTMLKQE
jgi:hypothetical protein